jgi:uncharacterized protein YecE (DUF72 family)
VEVNNTFYRLPEKRVFESWNAQTPEHFTFAVKASRFITHMKKLMDPEEHAALFLERASGLGEKLHLVLFQLPPFWKFNCERLGSLCRFLAGQTIVPGLRAAVEVRNPSWLGGACYDTLRDHNIALAFTDWPTVPVAAPVTADFVFVRRHGPAGLYSSDYSPPQLEADALRIREWRQQGRDVYEYFNNDVSGFAVKNAATLQQLVAT